MKFLNQIENIVFDLGNVILDVDFNATLHEFQKLGIINPKAIYEQTKESKLFLDFELGLITVNQFRKDLKKYTSKRISDDDIDKAWNKMLLPIPNQRIEILSKLKEKYRLFLLSNTNEIHYNSFSNKYPEILKYGTSSIFLKTYYSHIIHLRKPDKNIFDFVINDANIIPEKTIFIDDLHQNILAANSCKLKTLHISNGKDINVYFKQEVLCSDL